jgi:hypothetical protein
MDALKYRSSQAVRCARRGLLGAAAALSFLVMTSQAWGGNPANLLFPPSANAVVVPFAADGAQGNGPATNVDPLQRNDDDFAQAGFGMPAAPFVFNLYGTPYTGGEIFLNNNGNLSFGTGFTTFTSTGFPIANIPMVAPFWADVDTRSPMSGVASYEYIDSNVTPGADTLVVTWDNVGHFDSQTDRLNTFQVAISDGANPRMGLGNNVCFSYDDMAWTTGDASGGTNGFGGTPATVGVNKGDGATFFQIGLFDHEGVDYDGSGGASDGVSFLDNLDTCFSTVAAANQPPIAIGFPPSGVINVDPTLAQSINSAFQFIGPELGDAVTITSLNDFDGAVTDGLVAALANGDPATANLTWTTAALLPLVGNSYDLQFNFQDSFAATNSQSLRINVVPEPNALAMLALGIVTVAAPLLRRTRHEFVSRDRRIEIVPR